MNHLETIKTTDIWRNFEKTSSEYNEYFNKLLNLLEETKKNSNLNFSTISNTISSLLFSILGSIQLNLSTYFPIVDPVEKNRLKKLYCEEDENLIDQILVAFKIMRIIMNYNALGHTIVDELESKKLELSVKSENLKHKVALRPEICLYRELRKDISHFLQTCCQPKVLFSLFTRIQDCIARDLKTQSANEYFQEINDLMKNIELLFNNIERFESHTLQKFAAYYQDFVAPIETSLVTLKYGLNGLKHSLISIRDSIHVRPDETCYSITETQRLLNISKCLIEFPTNKRVSSLFDESGTADVPNIFSLLEKIDQSEENFLGLLNTTLLEVLNEIIISTNINGKIFSELDKIFNLYNKTWLKHEELKRKRQIEEESLIVTKTKCQDDDEEEIRMREINSIFPNYVEKDFGDYVVNDSLEAKKVISSVEKEKIKNGEIFGLENIKFVSMNFVNIMMRFVR